jgi:hypothetical protein
MARRRRVVFLMRDMREDLGFSPVPIQGASTICAVYRPVGSLATLIPVAFSAGPEGKE